MKLEYLNTMAVLLHTSLNARGMLEAIVRMVDDPNLPNALSLRNMNSKRRAGGVPSQQCGLNTELKDVNPRLLMNRTSISLL